MANEQMVMYDEEFKKIASICERLAHDAYAKAVLLIDKNGQFIASYGEIGDLDTTSLASLTAGNIAATSGLAQLIGEKEFPHIFHEGKKDNLHLSIVAHKAILVVMFDQRSSLGLVRLRVKKSGEELATIFNQLAEKSASNNSSTPFSEITDDDIDNLFGE